MPEKSVIRVLSCLQHYKWTRAIWQFYAFSSFRSKQLYCLLYPMCYWIYKSVRKFYPLLFNGDGHGHSCTQSLKLSTGKEFWAQWVIHSHLKYSGLCIFTWEYYLGTINSLFCKARSLNIIKLKIKIINGMRCSLV